MGYRVTFFLNLFRTFVIPFLTVWFALSFFPNKTIVPVPLLSAFFAPIPFTLRTLWISHKHARAARRLNALPIPIVRGNWPGNLDILKCLLHGWRHGYINETLRELCIQHQSPTINIRILWVDQIWTMDPNHMKHILVTGFRDFDKGAPQRERMKGFLGTGIFVADGEMWKMHRTMARPFLSKSTTSDTDLFTRHINDAFAQLDRLASSACAFDLQELSQRYTLDVALDALFGIRDSGTLGDPLRLAGSEPKIGNLVPSGMDADTDNLSTNRAAMLAATHAMDVAADVTIMRARQGVLWPLFEFRTDKQKEPARIMRVWIESVIHQARERKGARNYHDSETFLDHLVQSTDDENIIRDQLINMVLGSRDTTVAFLTFTIYLLALHPEVHAKLHTEVMTLCPPCAGMPTSDQLREFIYLRAILNETQRLFPSVPINTRYSASESVLPPAVWLYMADSQNPASTPPYYTQPLYMPPRTSISMLMLLMQRRADLWDADAEEFRPARWLPFECGGDGVNEAGGGGKRPEWFIPFSAGPRLCPGRNFAYAEVTYFLIAIVRRGYVFTLSAEHQPQATLPPKAWKTPRPVANAVSARVFVQNGRQAKEQCWPASAFTIYSKGGLWMKVSNIGD